MLTPSFLRSLQSFAKSLITALIVLIIYAGFILIVFDFRTHISWVGHVGGLIAGIVAAKFYAGSEKE